MHHKIRPFELSQSDRYSRLFAPTHPALDEGDECLKDLAWSMCGKTFPMSTAIRPKIPAGYTYFGQFIDHDMTIEDFSVLKSGSISEPRDTPNLRLNWLNLDCLYGDGPWATPKIYGSDGVSLLTGTAAANFDVPLDENHLPLTADSRNIENAILRQIHAMFLKLHNLAVKELPESIPPTRRFLEARRRVCHQYQWLVRHDFLARICDPAIYASVLVEPIFDWNGQFSIPIEFARAAFRFGHSMVRPEYMLKGGSIPLKDLFGDRGTPNALPSAHAVPWSIFLGPSATEFSMQINTGIISQLFHIPAPSVRLFRSVPAGVTEIALPHVTLRRGAVARLPSGQFARQVMQLPAINPNGDQYDPWLDATKYGFRETTPLWYYILLEAEVSGHGTRLGPVGSRIVAEVIEGALWANGTSFLRMHGRLWKPEPWVEVRTKKLRQIETLHDLAVVVGLT